ncbi:hypothetical protein [Phormidesmis sp. 146-33]
MQKPVIGRLRIWTDGQTIAHVGHISEGFGKMKTKSEWEQTPPEKRPRSLGEGITSHSDTPVAVERYWRCLDDQEKPDCWEALSDLAIEKWLERIQR